MPTLIRRSGAVTYASKALERRRTVSWQLTTGMWSPPTDLYETELEYLVTVEVAGMHDTDFEVIYENGMLLIAGKRPDVKERRAYHQMEIHFGAFSTAISVPGPVDIDHSVAEYTDGFLVVKMPKARSTDVRVEA
jgi:HSP20 family protein